MFRYLTGFALLLATSGAVWAQSAQSQTPRRTMTLSQRLEQFREDLVGEGSSDGDSQAVPTSEPVQNDSTTKLPLPKTGTAKKPAAPAAQPQTAQQQQAQQPQPTTATTAPRTANSSRRTAQPDYQNKVSQPTPAEHAAEPTDDLTQRPTPARKGAKPLSAAKRPETGTIDEAGEETAPRLARSLRTDVAPPATPKPKETAPEKAEKIAKPFKAPRDTDVLFSGQSPLLNVEASGPRKVLIGKPAVFSVKLRNAGDVAANNVVVTVNIPQFAEVAEAQPTAGATRAPSGTERSEPFEWKIARLEAHSREVLTLKIIPRKSVPIDLAVQWTCSPETSQTLVEVQEAKLMMALSGPDEVLYGQSKIYKLTLSNPGNGDAENVMVSLLPIGRASEGAMNHKLGNLRAGESKAIEVELTARQAGKLAIRAQAFADGGLRAEASEQVLVRRANLHLGIEGPKVKYAGTAGTYRIQLTNRGDATAENVQVAVILPTEAKYISSNNGGRVEADRGKVIWNAGTLQPDSERSLEVQCSLHAPGENRFQAISTGDDDVSASATAVTRVEALADLKLEIRDPQGPIPVGEDALFEVIIRNRGTRSAEGIDLVVFFSEGLEATSVQGGPHELGAGQVTFKTIPTLAANSETIYRVHARADRSGNHVFRAEVLCESLQTKLAAEETTRFYGDDAGESPTPARAGGEHMPHLQPVPQE
jgi:uncharacterized repeat protein (TIGR01451 family)